MGIGGVSCDSTLTAMFNLVLSFMSILRKWTIDLQFLMMGTPFTKALQSTAAPFSLETPLSTTILRSSLETSGMLDRWNLTPKSFSMPQQLKVTRFVLLGRIRQTASRRRLDALANLESFRYVVSFWQTQTMAAQLCSSLQNLRHCSSTGSSSQKQCSLVTKLAVRTRIVSLASPLPFPLCRHFSLQCAFFSSRSSSSKYPSGADISSPRSTALTPSRRSPVPMPIAMPSLLLNSSRQVCGCSGCRREIWAMLRVCRMLNLSPCRWELEVLSFTLSRTAYFSRVVSYLLRYFSTRRVQYSSTERLMRARLCGTSRADYSPR